MPISNFFKSSTVPLTVKQDITLKCAKFACRDLRPHPSTVSRKIADVAADVKQKTVMPELLSCLNKWSGGISYITYKLTNICMPVYVLLCVGANGESDHT